MALVAAVNSTLAALDLGPTDAALGELARTIAREIEERPEDVEKLSARLQAALDALLATPASRAKLKNADAESPLDTSYRRLAEMMSERK
jgi:hypothetical protein